MMMVMKMMLSHEREREREREGKERICLTRFLDLIETLREIFSNI